MTIDYNILLIIMNQWYNIIIIYEYVGTYLFNFRFFENI